MLLTEKQRSCSNLLEKRWISLLRNCCSSSHYWGFLHVPSVLGSRASPLFRDRKDPRYTLQWQFQLVYQATKLSIWLFKYLVFVYKPSPNLACWICQTVCWWLERESRAWLQLAKSRACLLDISYIMLPHIVALLLLSCDDPGMMCVLIACR